MPRELLAPLVLLVPLDSPDQEEDPDLRDPLAPLAKEVLLETLVPLVSRETLVPRVSLA